MEDNPDKDLYDPNELQVLNIGNIRGNLHYVDLLLISLFACPSFTKSIKRYIETNFKIPILSVLINDKLNGDVKQIYQVFLTIIVRCGPFKYFEFVFLLIYIIFHKAKILKSNEYSNYINISTKVLCTCLTFYYYNKLLYTTKKNNFAKSFKHTTYNLSLDVIFDKDYFTDFIQQTVCIEDDTNKEFRYKLNIFRTFVNFLRDAAQFNEEARYISNLFGDIIYHFDLHARLRSQYKFMYDAPKILIVINNMYGIPHILHKYDNSNIVYTSKFPEFINIRVLKQTSENKFTDKWLRYVLVVMYFTMTNSPDDKDHGNIIARFYKNNNKKYFRISKMSKIECGNNEKLSINISEETKEKLNPIYNTCDKFQDFDKYALMCIYHAYKWL